MLKESPVLQKKTPLFSEVSFSICSNLFSDLRSYSHTHTHTPDYYLLLLFFPAIFSTSAAVTAFLRTAGQNIAGFLAVLNFSILD